MINTGTESSYVAIGRLLKMFLQQGYIQSINISIPVQVSATRVYLLAFR
jgi:hypothetical protein